jgi:hypothetical protein
VSTFGMAAECVKKSCFTPNPTAIAMAIATIYRRMWNLLAREAVRRHHRSTAQRVNQPEVLTERFSGPMTKVPHNLRVSGVDWHLSTTSDSDLIIRARDSECRHSSAFSVA